MNGSSPLLDEAGFAPHFNPCLESAQLRIVIEMPFFRDTCVGLPRRGS
jgi:hypothetical protein